MLLFLVSTLVLIAEDGKLIMWIPKHPHTYPYRPRNISILGRSFFVKNHFGPNGILARIFRFVFPFSYFIFPISSSILFIYSYSPTIIYLSQKLHLFVMVITRMYQSCFSETDVDFIGLPRICVFYTFR